MLAADTETAEVVDEQRQVELWRYHQAIQAGMEDCDAAVWAGSHGDLILAASLTAPDRARVEGYVAHKYGVTATLPGGHPYKSVIPMITPGA